MVSVFVLKPSPLVGAVSSSPADAEDVAWIDLDIAAPEVVRRAHAEGPDHVTRERRGGGREALLTGDVFVIALDGEVEMRAISQHGPPSANPVCSVRSSGLGALAGRKCPRALNRSSRK
jgi:hypothetical protein